MFVPQINRRSRLDVNAQLITIIYTTDESFRIFRSVNKLSMDKMLSCKQQNELDGSFCFKTRVA